MEDVKRYLTVLGRLSECGKAPVKSSKFDVVAELTKTLVQALSEANVDSLIPLHKGDGTSPSTSQEPPSADPRIRLGNLLTSLYSELASSLSLCKKSCEDEFTVLSVQELALISSSFQFFVLAQILPYIEEGVGIPISKRSAYLKSWIRLTQDINFQKQQIVSGLNTLNELMSSNEALQSEILKSFLGDIICANEQLLCLGHPQLDWLENLLILVPKSLLTSNFLALSKTYDRTKPPPPWFTNALGKRLSDILSSEDGLHHTLSAYIELGGSQFWENSHLLCCFGKQLAVPPKGRKRMAYYENVTSQFLKIVFENGAFPKNGVVELYSTFVDEITKREPLAGEVFILDMLFKPFETLSESTVVSRSWTTSMSRSLILLGLFSDDKICPRTVSSSPRLVQMIPLLLGFLMSSCFDEETLPLDLKIISENIARILKFVGKKVENIHCLLMAFILSNEDSSYTIHFKKPLISVVGEESTDNSISLNRVATEEKEDLIMKKLDAVLKFVKMMDSSNSSRLLIEILCESVGMWTESVSTMDAPRFVIPKERSGLDPEWNRLASHLIALFCFEQLGEWDVDPTDPSVVEAIAKLIEAVLKGTVDWVLLEEADSRFFDVSRVPSEEQLRMTGIRQTSAKMAVGLTAAVMAAGTAEVADSLQKISGALSLFIASSSQFRDEDLLKTVDDAKQVIQLLNMLGMKAADLPSNSTAPSASKRRGGGGGDFVTELKKDLADEMVPIRGEALLRTAKALRRREKTVIDALEPWLYERIRELVSDPDSYVFLSAINALAEVACYDAKKYLDQLLKLFLELGKTPRPVEKDDSVLILRGKLAEVIGKVFRCLGDVAPFWVERAANIFLNSLKEESDIIRASSLSAFSDLVLSCRGKGLERILDELFFAVDLLVQNDPSELVRRAAVHLIRQCLRSCDRHILDVVGGRLRDLRRSLTRLWKWDRDHVVRLQAELCLEELRAGLQSALDEETTSMLRIINVK